MQYKITLRQLIIFFVLVLCLLLYFIVNNPCNMQLSVFYSMVSAIVCISSVLYTIKKKNFLCIANIVNAFLFMIFVARPLQIAIFPDTASQMHSFRMYATVYGFDLENMPLAQASLIGLLGICGLNMGSAPVGEYICPLQNKPTHGEIYQNQFSFKQIFTISIIVVAAFASESIYVIKAAYLGQRVRFFDLAWLYAFSIIIMYVIFAKGKPSLLTYIIIANCLLVFAISARRQYVVNLLLYFIVPLYYAGKNRKKNIKIIFLVAIILVVVVAAYGAIRRERISYETGSPLFEVMDEFCMFDMLTVSLDYKRRFDLDLFYGYNYLSIFNNIVPFVNIQQFDHMFTDIIMKGRYGGAMPSSLCGSLFFNFSYIGTLLGMTVFGYGIRKFENKMGNYSIDAVGYYTIAICFAYDLVRVGDIGREFWTMMVSLIAFIILKRIIPINQTAKVTERAE